MNQPLVSVIIPNYNHSVYLNQRIQSVLNQSYKNFEVIILDDKSTDCSVEVIEQYRNNSYVTHIVINENNSGSTFIQWNKGLKLAKGEVIWIAESDDYCEQTFLEKCISEYIKDPLCSIVYCSSEYVDSQGNDLGTFSNYDKEVYYLSGDEFIKERMIIGSAIWNASSAIFKKENALNIDKSYQKFKMCGDKLFWIKMAEKGNVIHVNKTLNYFRQHNNKVSPKRFRDGTWLTEEYKIFQYQCKNNHISFMKRCFALSVYYNKIIAGDFDSEEIKKSLIHLWKFDNIFKLYKIMFLSHIYQYFNLYILHKKNL